MPDQDGFYAVLLVKELVEYLPGPPTGDTDHVFDTRFFQCLDNQLVGCGHDVSLKLSGFSGQLSAFGL
jgi:hypothetical protein